VAESRTNNPEDQVALACALEETLGAANGPMMTGEALSRALGYRSPAALRQAKRRGQASIPLFTLPHRRPIYALTRDVAAFIAQMRFSQTTA